MESGSDMLGGRLDGLVWRVTLDEDGAPLIFDTIQPSGRFAMFFPTRRLMPDAHARANVDSLVEWVYSPIDVAIEDWVGETWPGPLSLHVSSRTHQLVGIAAPGKAWGTPVFDNPPYQLVSDDVLRALPVPGDGRRSIYNQDGIVSGTERLGRWLLWSMGISNMGAIRRGISPRRWWAVATSTTRTCSRSVIGGCPRRRPASADAAARQHPAGQKRGVAGQIYRGPADLPGTTSGLSVRLRPPASDAAAPRIPCAG